MIRKICEICYETVLCSAYLSFVIYYFSVWKLVVGVLLNHPSTVTIWNHICKPWSASG